MAGRSAGSGQKPDKPPGGRTRFDEIGRAQWHPKDTVGKSIDRGGTWHSGPLRRLSPGILAKPREGRKHSQCRAVPFGSKLGEQKVVKAGILQGERVAGRRGSLGARHHATALIEGDSAAAAARPANTAAAKNGNAYSGWMAIPGISENSAA